MTSRLARLLLPFAVLLPLLSIATPAHAGDYVDRAADAFKGERLYVDPDSDSPFSEGDLGRIRQRLDAGATPVFLAVLPAEAVREVSDDPNRLPAAVHAAAGLPGTYAVLAGNRFRAGSSIIGSRAGQIASEAVAAHRNSRAEAVLAFVDGVQTAAETGTSPAGGGQGGDSSVPWFLLLLAGGGGAALVLSQRRRRERRRQEAEQLAQLREVVDEDITAYGEELDRLDLDVSQATSRPGRTTSGRWTTTTARRSSWPRPDAPTTCEP